MKAALFCTKRAACTSTHQPARSSRGRCVCAAKHATCSVTVHLFQQRGWRGGTHTKQARRLNLPAVSFIHRSSTCMRVKARSEQRCLNQKQIMSIKEQRLKPRRGHQKQSSSRQEETQAGGDANTLIHLAPA